jgi:hypothetical protein
MPARRARALGIFVSAGWLLVFPADLARPSEIDWQLANRPAEIAAPPIAAAKSSRAEAATPYSARPETGRAEPDAAERQSLQLLFGDILTQLTGGLTGGASGTGEPALPPGQHHQLALWLAKAGAIDMQRVLLVDVGPPRLEGRAVYIRPVSEQRLDGLFTALSVWKLQDVSLPTDSRLVWQLDQRLMLRQPAGWLSQNTSGRAILNLTSGTFQLSGESSDGATRFDLTSPLSADKAALLETSGSLTLPTGTRPLAGLGEWMLTGARADFIAGQFAASDNQTAIQYYGPRLP